MTRILFADDDAPVLEGLRTRLYRQSSRWDMVFVDSAAGAIAELDRAAVDVIVTDMRMPAMDGAQLLQTVSERWPDVVRIVLSGYAEREQVLRLVPVAHQYLSKPCDAQRLVSIIEKCVALRALLPNGELRARVGRLRALPTMAGVLSRLQARMACESLDVQETAAIVASDPMTAAKVLQLANSAFFRLARSGANIDQAVAYIGVAALRSVLASPAVFLSWPDEGPMREVDFGRLQAHSHAMAAGALALAGAAPWADEALLAGLLHNIGYWVLALESPRELAAAVAAAAQERIPLHVAETRVMGASHAQVGAYLLGIWGLPPAVVEAVAHHHDPAALAQPQLGPLAALALARALLPSEECEAFAGGLVRDSKVDASYLSSLQAPLDWPEATRRISQMLDSQEAAA
ncbi:MAG TPA: HDOD domain-containing protein [Steroidobacteraceae bacterium]|jgi:HD-like signal output (HDOD) protein